MDQIGGNCERRLNAVADGVLAAEPENQQSASRGQPVAQQTQPCLQREVMQDGDRGDQVVADGEPLAADVGPLEPHVRRHAQRASLAENLVVDIDRVYMTGALAQPPRQVAGATTDVERALDVPGQLAQHPPVVVRVVVERVSYVACVAPGHDAAHRS